MGSNIEDPINLAGISYLINTENANADIDFLKLEKEMISGVPDFKQDDTDIETRTRQRIGDILRTHGIDDDTMSKISTAKAQSNFPVFNPNSTDDSLDGILQDVNLPTKQINYDLSSATEEQYKSTAVRNVMGDNTGYDEFNLEKENEESVKINLYDKIQSLVKILQISDKSVEKYLNIPPDASMATLQSASDILERKNTRLRSSALAEDIIIGMAKGAGAVFNGKRAFLGAKPNLQGFHHSVKHRLTKMRYDTSTVVSDTLDYYNVGPLGRIFLELIPSAIIYGSTHSGTNTVEEEERNAYATINSQS